MIRRKKKPKYYINWIKSQNLKGYPTSSETEYVFIICSELYLRNKESFFKCYEVIILVGGGGDQIQSSPLKGFMIDLITS